jgi:hypothetical protein
MFPGKLVHHIIDAGSARKDPFCLFAHRVPIVPRTTGLCKGGWLRRREPSISICDRTVGIPSAVPSYHQAPSLSPRFCGA